MMYLFTGAHFRVWVDVPKTMKQDEYDKFAGYIENKFRDFAVVMQTNLNNEFPQYNYEVTTIP